MEMWACHVAYWTICVGSTHCLLDPNTGKLHVLCGGILREDQPERGGEQMEITHPPPTILWREDCWLILCEISPWACHKETGLCMYIYISNIYTGREQSILQQSSSRSGTTERKNFCQRSRVCLDSQFSHSYGAGWIKTRKCMQM